MNVGFFCPACEHSGRATLPANEPWRCGSCGHLLSLTAPTSATSDMGLSLQSCAICGNHELYKMKGFPHWLGLSILALGFAVFLVGNALYLKWLAWAGLLGSWLIDVVLYKLVNDVVVCYRCGAKHAGVGRSGNEPFELTVHERYRQERLQSR